jgi:sirohydrochlorin ferrochelatase
LTSLLLVSHGSRDAAAQQTTERIAAAVSAQLAGVPVGVGYLELVSPTVREALDRLARPVVVQPLLFAPAYHATTDLPDQLGTRDDVIVARVLAPDPLLYAALDRRLAEAPEGAGGAPPDGLVLASAGTSSAAARDLVHEVAEEWAARHGVAGAAAFASAAPSAGDAVRALRESGCRRVAVGSLFIAPGRLPRTARESALSAGAVAVAAPLGLCPELIGLLVHRFHEARSARANA